MLPINSGLIVPFNSRDGRRRLVAASNRATAETGIPSRLPILPQAECAGAADGVAPRVRLGFALAASKFRVYSVSPICNGMQPVATHCIGLRLKANNAARNFSNYRLKLADAVRNADWQCVPGKPQWNLGEFQDARPRL